MEPNHLRPVNECKICTSKYPLKDNIKKCSFINKKGKICNNTNLGVAYVYCLDKILNYPVFLRCIIGRRRGGKTYALAERCIERWKNKGYKTMWLRRYKTEYKKALDAFVKLGYFLDNHGVYEINIEKESKFNKKKQEYEDVIIEKKIYFVELTSITTASRLRGGEFKEFNIIVWDEYGDESQTYKKNEEHLFYSTIVSIFDERTDCEAWILSNNCNKFLPIWVHLKLNWSKEWNYNYMRDSIVHIWDTSDYDMKGSASKFLKETEYYQYAFKNRALDNNNAWLVDTSLIQFLEPEFCIAYKNFNHKVYKVDIINKEIDNFYIITTCYSPCEFKNSSKLYILDDYASVVNTKIKNEVMIQTIKNMWWNKSIRFTHPFIRDSFISFIMNIE